MTGVAAPKRKGRPETTQAVLLGIVSGPWDLAGLAGISAVVLLGRMTQVDMDVGQGHVDGHRPADVGVTGMGVDGGVFHHRMGLGHDVVDDLVGGLGMVLDDLVPARMGGGLLVMRGLGLGPVGRLMMFVRMRTRRGRDRAGWALCRRRA